MTILRVWGMRWRKVFRDLYPHVVGGTVDCGERVWGRHRGPYAGDCVGSFGRELRGGQSG